MNSLPSFYKIDLGMATAVFFNVFNRPHEKRMDFRPFAFVAHGDFLPTSPAIEHLRHLIITPRARTWRVRFQRSDTEPRPSFVHTVASKASSGLFTLKQVNQAAIAGSNVTEANRTKMLSECSLVPVIV